MSCPPSTAVRVDSGLWQGRGTFGSPPCWIQLGLYCSHTQSLPVQTVKNRIFMQGFLWYWRWSVKTAGVKIPEEPWLISGAPPARAAKHWHWSSQTKALKKTHSLSENLQFTFNRWQCSVLFFCKTGCACKLKEMCVSPPACATRCCLFGPPSLLPSQQPFTLFCKGSPRF